MISHQNWKIFYPWQGLRSLDLLLGLLEEVSVLAVLQSLEHEADAEDYYSYKVMH
jgi:hypothetical protein